MILKYSWITDILKDFMTFDLTIVILKFSYFSAALPIDMNCGIQLSK
jgi:hypothetical protein